MRIERTERLAQLLHQAAQTSPAQVRLQNAPNVFAL